MAKTDIDRVRRYYERAAPQYDSGMRWFERLLLGDGRRDVCSRARGRTLELGVGTGLNLALYAARLSIPSSAHFRCARFRMKRVR